MSTDITLGPEKRASRKRVRGTVRMEASILADLILDAVLPAVDQAVEETRSEVVGTDWVRRALTFFVQNNRDEIVDLALQEIRAEQKALAA